jgi:hypothetical protein
MPIGVRELRSGTKTHRFTRTWRSLPSVIMADFQYREYRLSVKTHTPGLKVLIYPPGSSLPLPTIPFHRDRAKLDDLIEEAKHIVEDHQLMSRVSGQ